MIKITGTTVEQITLNAIRESGINLGGMALAMALTDARWRKKVGGKAALRNFLSDLIKTVEETGSYPK